MLSNTHTHNTLNTVLSLTHGSLNQEQKARHLIKSFQAAPESWASALTFSSCKWLRNSCHRDSPRLSFLSTSDLFYNETNKKKEEKNRAQLLCVVIINCRQKISHRWHFYDISLKQGTNCALDLKCNTKHSSLPITTYIQDYTRGMIFCFHINRAV